MNKRFFFKACLVAAVSILAFSCDRVPKETFDQVTHDLQKRSDSLQNIINHKDVAINEFITSFIEIQNSLNAIKEKEEMVTIQSSDARGDFNRNSAKESITKDINDIYEKLSNNKKRVASLQHKLKQANIQIKGFEEMIQGLESQIAERDQAIAKMRADIQGKENTIKGLEGTIATMNEQISGMEGTIGNQQGVINSAWIRIAPRRTLLDEGVINRRGKVLQNQTGTFEKVDITTLTEIPIDAARMTIMSSHPENSYEIIKEGRHVVKVVIKNPTSFWSIQRCFVAQVR